MLKVMQISEKWVVVKGSIVPWATPMGYLLGYPIIPNQSNDQHKFVDHIVPLSVNC